MKDLPFIITALVSAMIVFFMSIADYKSVEYREKTIQVCLKNHPPSECFKNK